MPDFDPTTFPENLQPLVPLLDEWAISDDDEREQKIESSSTETLQAVLKQVEPRFDAINKFLDSFGDSPPEDACLIGTLAECACEIQMELESRSE